MLSPSLGAIVTYGYRYAKKWFEIGVDWFEIGTWVREQGGWVATNTPHQSHIISPCYPPDMKPAGVIALTEFNDSTAPNGVKSSRLGHLFLTAKQDNRWGYFL